MIKVAHTFRDAIQASGLQPPDVIVPSKLYRFPGIGKRKGNTAGWCLLFDDGLGGCFGDWSSGFTENWQAKREKPYTVAERIEFKRHIKKARIQAEAERKEKYAAAAKKATAIWKEATPVIFHEYLKHKQILPMGIRIDRHNNLLIPLTDGQDIHSIQFIQPDGTKRFLTGGKTKGMHYSIRLNEQPEKLMICEGFATGATLYMETKTPVIVAFTAANLVPVARAIRKQFPKAEILICGDNDQAKENNVGRHVAIEAAAACGGRWIIPDFTGMNPTPKDTDFNDLARLQRLVK